MKSPWQRIALLIAGYTLFAGACAAASPRWPSARMIIGPTLALVSIAAWGVGSLWLSESFGAWLRKRDSVMPALTHVLMVILLSVALFVVLALVLFAVARGTQPALTP